MIMVTDKIMAHNQIIVNTGKTIVHRHRQHRQIDNEFLDSRLNMREGLNLMIERD